MLLNCGAGEETLEGPLDCKEIQPVNPKGNRPWILTWRTDAVAEAPIHWTPDVKNWLTENDPNAGKDWRQEEKVGTEDDMRCYDGIADSVDMSLYKLNFGR